MAEFDRVVTYPRLRLADLRSHLGRRRPVAVLPGRLPGGTTRYDWPAVDCAFSNEEAAVWRAASARPMLRMGIEFGSRFAALGSPSPVHVTRRCCPARGVGPPISAATPISQLVAALNAQQPEVSSVPWHLESTR